MKNDISAASRAFASAFVADIESALPLKAALLRKEIGRSGLTRIVMRDLDAARVGKPGPVLFPNLRAVAREFLDQEERRVAKSGVGQFHNRAAGYMQVSPAREVPVSGLGQWDAIASAIGAAAGAASSIYGAVTNADAQKELLKLEQQKVQAQIQIAQMQAKAAQVQLAAANAAVSGTPVLIGPDGLPIQSGGSFGPEVAGIPIVPAVAGAVALAIAGYFAFKK